MPHSLTVSPLSIRSSLAWPNLDIKTAAGETVAGGLELIQNSVAHPRPNLDGSSGYALQCVFRDGCKTHTYFAKTNEERQEWCKILRKHAVHHNLDNGFEVTRKVLGTGAYATVYLAKDKLTNQVSMSKHTYTIMRLRRSKNRATTAYSSL